MLNVVNEQLLMLHFMLCPEPHKRQELARFSSVARLIKKLEHSIVDPASIPESILHSGTRTSAPLVFVDSRAEALVIRIEVIQILVRINLIAGRVFLQQQLEEP